MNRHGFFRVGRAWPLAILAVMPGGASCGGASDSDDTANRAADAGAGSAGSASSSGGDVAGDGGRGGTDGRGGGGTAGRSGNGAGAGAGKGATGGNAGSTSAGAAGGDALGGDAAGGDAAGGATGGDGVVAGSGTTGGTGGSSGAGGTGGSGGSGGFGGVGGGGGADCRGPSKLCNQQTTATLPRTCMSDPTQAPNSAQCSAFCPVSDVPGAFSTCSVISYDQASISVGCSACIIARKRGEP